MNFHIYTISVHEMDMVKQIRYMHSELHFEVLLYHCNNYYKMGGGCTLATPTTVI